jgi:hypothetical protein
VTRRSWAPLFLRLLLIGVGSSLGFLGPTLLFCQDSASGPASYIVIDSHIYRRSDTPKEYQTYMRTAASDEIVSINTVCVNRLSVGSNPIGEHLCTVAFYPKFPYHSLSLPVRKELTRSIQAVGGKLVDWGVHDGQITGLGVKVLDANGTYSPPMRDPELVHVEAFLVAQMGSQQRVRLLPPLAAANGDIQSIIDSPHSFCLESSPKLICAWDAAALVGCGSNSAYTPFTPFFIFPTTTVSRWWDEPWAINGGADGSRHPLCNIFLGNISFIPNSSKISILAPDPGSVRVHRVVTLDLETGRFFMGGKLIYPEPSRPEGDKRAIRPSSSRNQDDGAGQPAEPSTREGLRGCARQPSNDGEHEGKQQVERPDGD